MSGESRDLVRLFNEEVLPHAAKVMRFGQTDLGRMFDWAERCEELTESADFLDQGIPDAVRRLMATLAANPAPSKADLTEALALMEKKGQFQDVEARSALRQRSVLRQSLGEFMGRMKEEGQTEALGLLASNRIKEDVSLKALAFLILTRDKEASKVAESHFPIIQVPESETFEDGLLLKAAKINDNFLILLMRSIFRSRLEDSSKRKLLGKFIESCDSFDSQKFRRENERFLRKIDGFLLETMQ